MATNKVYVAYETPITFGDSGQTVTMTLLNLAVGAGRISPRVDRGTGSKPSRYFWRMTIQLETAGAVGEMVELYLSESDGTNPDGEVGVVDAALTSDKRRNLGLPFGIVQVDTTATATNMTASGVVEIYDRYFSIGVWNGTTDNLENTTNACKLTLTPVPDDIQASA